MQLSNERDDAGRTVARIDTLLGSRATSLAELFEGVSKSHPHKIAVVCGSVEVSFEHLDKAGNHYANQIAALDLPKDAIVAIYLDRSIEMLSAMLGVLKAGRTYLPIDPTYPTARVAETVEDAQPAVLITDRRLAANLPALACQILLIEDVLTADGMGMSYLQPEHRNEIAYVMYTSGSTGKPKGVLVTDQNVIRLLDQTKPWFHFNEADVWTMFHSFAFDFSVWEIWGPLLTGGKLVIVPFAVSRSPEDFYALLSEQKVTILNQTPSAFSMIDRLEEAGTLRPLALRTVIFGGEALHYRSLRNWFRRHGDRTPTLVNMYGITETTVHVTYRVVTEADALTEQDSLIGEPIPDLQLRLLDPDGHPVAEGETGELCIGGAGVAKGYLNRPELTAERFVPDADSPGMSYYRSGDLARRRADGELVYLGRSDGQVKINGFRIEVGEVEAAIADYPGVQTACVIAHTDHVGLQRLAAYFVVAGSTTVAVSDLSKFLTERLPAQMIPAFYTQLAAIPLTGNGKVDRAALPKPMSGSNALQAKPGSKIQGQVTAIWRKVLEASNVGLDDNFFDIGGSSILLIAMRAALQAEFGRAIPITWMFEFTTIRTLADKLLESSAPGLAPEKREVFAGAQEQARKQREAFARLREAKGAKR
jgi:amino acid adenylation domain-containing protein